jgi:D-alanyl-D-alanine carboxypeptidase/D-alanyl-D-alanine-endopeptidase (penicillin-binding protein 4)
MKTLDKVLQFAIRSISKAAVVSCGATFLITSCGPKPAARNAGDAFNFTSGDEETSFAVGGSLSPREKAALAAALKNPGDSSTPQMNEQMNENDGSDTTQISVKKGINAGVDSLGPHRVSQNSTQGFVPASITKVITSSVALKTLGRDFRFRTIVRWENGTEAGVVKNLSIVADGDPQVARASEGAAGVGRARLNEIVAGLHAAGIQKIVGSLNLLAIDERLDTPVIPDGVGEQDMRSCYGAFSQAFNFEWNCASLVIRGPNDVGWLDSDVDFPIRSNVIAGKRQGLSIVAEKDQTGAVAGYYVRGSMKTGRHRKTVGDLVPIADVKTWYGNVLISKLRAKGIDVRDVKIAQPAGAQARQLLQTLSRIPDGRNGFSLYSDPLSVLIRHMDKVSDNFFADTLFKAFARHAEQNSNDIRAMGTEQVLNSVVEWMKENKTEALAKEIHLVDGAGLSIQNHVTARAYMALLERFSKNQNFDVIWDSLPIAGVDGTLKNRMKGTRAQGKVRAKTGTLNGYYQLAGYVPKLGADGKPVDFIPFVILTNTSSGHRFNVYDLQSRLANKLMDAINPPTPEEMHAHALAVERARHAAEVAAARVAAAKAKRAGRRMALRNAAKAKKAAGQASMLAAPATNASEVVQQSPSTP